LGGKSLRALAWRRQDQFTEANSKRTGGVVRCSRLRQSFATDETRPSQEISTEALCAVFQTLDVCASTIKSDFLMKFFGTEKARELVHQSPVSSR
jgi:hypothetical protein